VGGSTIAAMDARVKPPRYSVWFQAQGPFAAQGLPWLVRCDDKRPQDERPLAYATEAEARAAAAELEAQTSPTSSSGRFR